MIMELERAICSLKTERSTVSNPEAVRTDNKDPSDTEQPQEYL